MFLTDPSPPHPSPNQPCIVTLVPRLRPAIDGVGDYADRLAEQLQQQFGITSHFIVADPTWQNPGDLSFSAQAIPQRSTSALLSQLNQLQATIVLVHYVPHGYAHKACPLWLIQALDTWRNQQSHHHLVTMFHELYACDWQRPWSSDFWLSPVQKAIAAQLSQISDACLTSSEKYAHQLVSLSHGKHNQPRSLPVFSNMGEPTGILPLSQRQPKLILFGQRHSKTTIYTQALAELIQVCQHLGIEEVWDIGPKTGKAPTAIEALRWREWGECSPSKIHELLSQARVGFLAYDPHRLAKSGIFAAYCAYGLLPINHRGRTIRTDGLTLGKQYCTPHFILNQGRNTENWEQIAQAAQQWYANHTVAQHALAFAKALPIQSREISTRLVL